MNQWSIRRRRLALFVTIVILVVLVGLPLYFFLHVTPNCHDGKQNGDETGVDCGGSCTTLCSTGVLPIISLGDPRVIAVASSTYEVVLYVENPNPGGAIYRANYAFTLYDATSSVPLKTINGSTFVPRNAKFALFEGPFNLETKPARAAFAWDSSSLNWVTSTRPLIQISVDNTGVTAASTSPRLEATAKNDSLSTATNIQFTALVSDDTGTIAAVSRTYLDTLEPGKAMPLVFTWPKPFAFTPASVEIVPVVLPDASFVR